jgi:hypothetical protein
MPFPKKRKALQFTESELCKLESIRRSRTEEKRRSQGLPSCWILSPAGAIKRSRSAITSAAARWCYAFGNVWSSVTLTEQKRVTFT